MEDVAALKTALGQAIAPYRRRLLRALSPSWLVVDFDLTGLVVSDQATTYEGADFGHLGQGSGDAGVARGCFARAQVAGETDAFVLGGFLHPGRTVSTQCLAELVTLTERRLGRPHRRVDCVQARLADAEHNLAQREAELPERMPPFEQR